MAVTFGIGHLSGYGGFVTAAASTDNHSERGDHAPGRNQASQVMPDARTGGVRARTLIRSDFCRATTQSPTASLMSRAAAALHIDWNRTRTFPPRALRQGSEVDAPGPALVLRQGKAFPRVAGRCFVSTVHPLAPRSLSVGGMELEIPDRTGSG